MRGSTLALQCALLHLPSILAAKAPLCVRARPAVSRPVHGLLKVAAGWTRRPAATTRAMAAATTTFYAEGQDMGELFELYEAPASLGVLPSGAKPKSLGVSKPRKLVHAEGDWHRAVHIWLMNDKGELLMQRRSKFKDTYPGMWDVSVGGHMTAGDDSMLTARKEAAEELGVAFDDADLKFLFTISTSAQGSTERHGNFKCNEYKDIYLLRFNGSLADVHFSEGEVEEVKWEPYDQVERRMQSRDPTYICRSDAYVGGLFAAIRSNLPAAQH